MDKYTFIYIGTVSFIGSLASFLYGGFTLLLFFLIAFVVVDYITGIMAAIVEKKLSSRVGFKGIAQKVFIFAIVSIAHVLDIILGTIIIKDMTILFYLINEFISIIENASRIGVPIPVFLKKLMEIVKKKSNL